MCVPGVIIEVFLSQCLYESVGKLVSNSTETVLDVSTVQLEHVKPHSVTAARYHSSCFSEASNEILVL